MAQIIKDPAEPPGGGRQDHEAMHAAAMRRLEGPGSSGALAAIGGGELPGREMHHQATPLVVGWREPIPGERDPTTLTHREPGALGGRFTGDDIPPGTRVPIDPITARERAREGGGRG